MDAATAFRLLPTAHHYDIKSVLQWCCEAVKRSPLNLQPSTPIAASEVPNHPGLIQWLALADEKQCRPVLDACMEKLLSAQDKDKGNRGTMLLLALASKHLREMVSSTPAREQYTCKYIL